MGQGDSIYQPLWMRLPEAITWLKQHGISAKAAKAIIIRAIQDRLLQRGIGEMFRLPEWRYSPRFPWRGWIRQPNIDWKHSTIVAPHALGMRRIPDDRPTLIEISARALKHEFAKIEPSPVDDSDKELPAAAKSGVRSRPTYDRAAGAIRSLYGDNIPTQTDKPNSALCKEVANWLKSEGKPAVGNDTILRAAGRRPK